MSWMRFGRLVRVSLPAAASLLIAGMGGARGEGELLANPSFAGQALGWELRDAEVAGGAGRGGGEAVRLDCRGFGRGIEASVRTTVKAVPGDRELRFGCWVRGVRKGFQVRAQAIGTGADEARTAQHRQWVSLDGVGWRRLEMRFAVPPGTTALAVEVGTAAPGSVFVAEPSLTAGGPRKAPLYELGGVGVIRATAWAGVRAVEAGGTGTVTFPIPGTYRGQVPLSFEVEAKPAEALVGYRRVKRPDGMNWLCEVTVKPPAEGASVGWEALILVAEEDREPLPVAERPEVPAEAAGWLKSTACVQADDPEIVAKAEELAVGAGDLETYAKRVMHFTATYNGRPGAPFRSLDAKQAMACGGSCTSRANLGAALLRARGIPARTVAHLPTWSGPLYEHWLVEYWHPGAGWTWLETSYDKFRPQPWTLAVLNVASPEDEDGAFDPLQCRFVTPGAPRWSVHVSSAGLREDQALKGEGTHNLAAPEVRLEGDAEEREAMFAAARAAYERLRRGGEAGAIAGDRAGKVREGMAAGRARELSATLERLAGPEGG